MQTANKRQGRIYSDLEKRKIGADNRSRTYDLRITNALLYQLSYIGPERPVTSVTTGQKSRSNRGMRQCPFESNVYFCITRVFFTHKKYICLRLHPPDGTPLCLEQPRQTTGTGVCILGCVREKGSIAGHPFADDSYLQGECPAEDGREEIILMPI